MNFVTAFQAICHCILSVVNMLVCNLIAAMQSMLDICSQEAEIFDFSFNTEATPDLLFGFSAMSSRLKMFS